MTPDDIVTVATFAALAGCWVAALNFTGRSEGRRAHARAKRTRTTRPAKKD